MKTIAFHARNVEYNPKVRGNPNLLRTRRGAHLFSVPLRRLILTRTSSVFSSQRFAAAIMRIRAPKTTALIFSSGKMVCTGAKTEALAREAARKYAKVISKLGFPAQFKVRIARRPT